ncbi:MAG TPA: AAA family ATPase [Nitrososphaera sp.]|nr:AAA family ATPase [Nitrososphaera sp.]
MIKDIQLKDFIAHRDTRLEFGRGVTIFVGHNGSGKSSVIDAITFALFAEHMRGRSNKNLVRRGANSAMVQMHFTMNSREFSVVRGLSSSGQQSFSQLMLVSDGSKVVNRPLAGGERRQFDESMKREVEKVLGLDYRKMCVAAIVQQGELLRIIEAKPKDFKELLNGLVGIDRLDSAYETMHEVIREFRDRLRDELGYTDEEIAKVEKLLEERKRELKAAESALIEFEEEERMLDERIRQLEKEIERMEPISQQARELQNRERRLLHYINEKRSQIIDEIAKQERIAKEARLSLQAVKDKDEVDIQLEMVRSEIDELESKIGENEGAMGKLRAFLEFAGRIKLTDEGRCPVCNSAVTKVNDLFDISHIQSEIKSKTDERSKLQLAKLELRKEEAHLLETNKKIAVSEKLLLSNSISSLDDVLRIEIELAKKRDHVSKLPSEIFRVEDPMQLSIDDVSMSLAEEIVTIKELIRSFSPAQYNSAKEEKIGLLGRLEQAHKKIGGYQHTAEEARKFIDSSNKTIVQLQQASEFVRMLEKIRSSVFYRDGTLGKSIRSWAVKVISEKASEYASLFNIGISRIELSEDAREIAITCYGRQGEIDMDSLSGGEKVSVALALRLGIAYMMGSNKLDFIILDEPTTHLDEERRKALVRIISEAFREGAGPLAQLIIITHDSDIFEDSEVEQVFRFTMTTEGSKVSQQI